MRRSASDSSAVLVRAALPARVARTLAARAELRMVTASQFLIDVVCAAMAAPDVRPMTAENLPGLPMSDAHRSQVLRRVRIVKGWRLARASSLSEATAAYLRRVERNEGVRLCVGTLYNWDRAYRRGGVAALADRRRVAKGDDRTGIKGRSIDNRRAARTA